MVALNEAGQTWAGAIRTPALGTNVSRFLSSKHEALEVINPLSDELSSGVEVGPRCALRFSGASCLIEPKSTQLFLAEQVNRSSTVIDELSGQRKTLQAKSIETSVAASEASPESQLLGSELGSTPWFLSRGAPASETLEEFPHLAEDVFASLGVLHRCFPKRTFSAADAVSAVAEALEEVSTRALEWVPETNAGSKVLDKFVQAWSERPDLARCEAFLRSASGREVVAGIVDRSQSTDPTEGFVHGDAHAGNFIIVWFEYESSFSDPIDREFVNSCFERHSEVSTLYYRIDSHSPFTAAVTDIPHPGSMKLRRAPHFEVHPIDLDDAGFTTHRSQLVDLVALACSASQLSQAILGLPLVVDEVVDCYLSARTNGHT